MKKKPHNFHSKPASFAPKPHRQTDNLSTDVSEPDASLLEAKLQDLEKRQQAMTNYYANKIDELMVVMANQRNTKTQLSR
jgi:hypothetical protein